MTQAEYVTYHQLDHYFMESKRTILGSLILSSAVLYILISVSVSLNTSIMWYLIMATVTFARYRHARLFFELKYASKQPDQRELQKFSKQNIALLIATSSLWAIAYAFIMIKGDAAYDLIAMLITIGFAGSSILSAAAKFRFYLAINFIASAVALTTFLFQDHPVDPIESILSILAVSFIFLSAYHFSKRTKDSLINAYQVNKAKKDIIQVLGRAGEYRDEETGFHILRMSYSCYLLGKELGFSEERAKELQSASTLHDVGKIGIPDSILLKQGRLTDEEMAIMQTHTEIGSRILSVSDSPITNLGQSICLTHHERWDGTGYPHGLQGEQIPIEGRITAICDVFDALTSERPYKKAWSTDKAVQFLKDNAGSHFDPELVPKFLNILPEVLECQRQQPETAKDQHSC